ncbi:MAG: citrate lyase ligase [Acidobacteria bacterium]|nr:citrate lyase ligase [Acidobacteriota bacterium]
MVPPAFPLLTSREREEARRLVEAQGLSFEPCDDVVGIHVEDRIVATGARAGCVLKLFAVDDAYQGGEALGRLVDALTQRARAAGEDTLLVFTRPLQAASFEACNFRLLASSSEAALLEHGGGLDRYLAAHAHLRRPGEHGAVVVNGNPFTLGHLHLVKTAAAGVDTLYLFVVREDRSVFPFAARLALAREATRHLRNVIVLDTSRYAISAATFPSYFLRRADQAARVQMEVDAHLFGQRLAPAFSIARRFVGDEPFCETTAAYNRVLAETLPTHGVALEVVPRMAERGAPISASRVRALLAAGDLEAVAPLVPPATMAYLRSPAGAAIARRLAEEAGGAASGSKETRGSR